MDDDQKDKRAVLTWMVKNNLEQIEDVGRVMKTYYSDETGFIKSVLNNTAPSKVL